MTRLLPTGLINETRGDRNTVGSSLLEAFTQVCLDKVFPQWTSSLNLCCFISAHSEEAAIKGEAISGAHTGTASCLGSGLRNSKDYISALNRAFQCHLIFDRSLPVMEAFQWHLMGEAQGISGAVALRYELLYTNQTVIGLCVRTEEE